MYVGNMTDLSPPKKGPFLTRWKHYGMNWIQKNNSYSTPKGRSL